MSELEQKIIQLENDLRTDHLDFEYIKTTEEKREYFSYLMHSIRIMHSPNYICDTLHA